MREIESTEQNENKMNSQICFHTYIILNLKSPRTVALIHIKTADPRGFSNI